MYRIRLIIICLLSINVVEGQLRNSIFREPYLLNLDSADFEMYKFTSASERLGAEFITYIRNHEYSESHNPGYSLLGQQIRVGFQNKLSEKDILSIGIISDFPFGGSYSDIKTWPVIRYNRLGNNYVFNAGSIQSHINHNLIEPLYNYEDALIKPVEYGLQYFFDNGKFRWESWLDWRQFSRPKISQQEIISFGNTGSIKWFESKNSNLTLSSPFSVLVLHKGGENLKVGKPIVNQLNANVGFRGLINNKIQIEAHLLNSYDASPRLVQAFKDGLGYFSSLQWYQKNHTVSLSHFYAKDYFAPLGPSLYNNYNPKLPYNISKVRNFVHLRYLYGKALANGKAYLETRLEPIYHIPNKQFAWSASLFIKVKLGNGFLLDPSTYFYR